MAALSSFTTTAAVRAVLGVSSDSGELPDQYFEDRSLGTALTLEFGKWLPDTAAHLSSAATSGGEGSAAWLTWEAIKQAAAYWCGWEIVGTGALAFFQQIGDGQDRVSRPTIDLAKLRAALLEGYLAYKETALENYSGAEVTGTSDATWAFGKSSPSYDPVTGA